MKNDMILLINAPIFRGAISIILTCSIILLLLLILEKRNKKIKSSNNNAILNHQLYKCDINSIKEKKWTIPIHCKENPIKSNIGFFPNNFEQYGICIIGAGHQAQSVPCQDCIGWEMYDSKNGIICVSDGLSSAKKSEVGAKTIVNSVLRSYLCSREQLCNLSMEPKKFLQETILSVHKDLEILSKEDKSSIVDYAATIIICLIQNLKIYTLHIGDGAVILRSNGNLFLLSPPENLEYENVIHTVIDENYYDKARYYTFFDDFDVIAVFSDGIQRASIIKKNGKSFLFEGFFNPIFKFIDSNNDKVLIKQEIEKLLLSEKMNNISDDDKSLVIFYKRNSHEF